MRKRVKMRWNVNEVAALAHQPPEWEGRLMHRDGRGGKVIQRFSNGRSGEFKERWVRLRANCLFYWRHTNGSAKPALGPGRAPRPILQTPLYHLRRTLRCTSQGLDV